MYLLFFLDCISRHILGTARKVEKKLQVSYNIFVTVVHVCWKRNRADETSFLSDTKNKKYIYIMPGFVTCGPNEALVVSGILNYL